MLSLSTGEYKVMPEYDQIIVGGGIAGLTLALRLATDGQHVIVLEKQKLGYGATTRNQGILHSGALFSLLHPEITHLCRQGQAAYLSSFSDAILDAANTWYVAPQSLLDTFRRLWDEQSIQHHTVEPDLVTEFLTPGAASTMDLAVIKDRFISSYLVVSDLTARCLASGVEIVIESPVKKVETRNRTALGVIVGASETLTAKNTVLACGAGIKEILQKSESFVASSVKLRLDTMVKFPSKALTHGLISLEYGQACIAPTLSNSVLATRYGAKLPWVESDKRVKISLAEIASIGNAAASLVRPEYIDTSQGVGWNCIKTEYSSGSHDRWGVEPRYALIDHSASEGIKGLWTIIPGKMTLALHASRDLASILLGAEVSLHLPDNRATQMNRPQSYSYNHLVTPDFESSS
jgi:hypothetical protein